MGETEEHQEAWQDAPPPEGHGYGYPPAQGYGYPQPPGQGYGYPQPPGQGYGYPQPGSGMADLVTTAAVTMAVTPFLQAVAAHFGTKLAGAIDDGTRAAVRRFLRRESGRRAEVPQAESPRPLGLRTEQGWHVVIPVDIPAEALPQLDVVGLAPPPLAPEPTPCIQWIGNAWHVMGAQDGVTVLWRWDAATGRWTR
ncbi:hypothetical protein [Streptomyces olivaceiscleroticus]|uniref:Uncharacterized protein n=1 Tax=Streptomyces olivaceiscleroticus TaxID=68245 RepID=A0ABP3KH55_9ACTN